MIRCGRCSTCTPFGARACHMKRASWNVERPNTSNEHTRDEIVVDTGIGSLTWVGNEGTLLTARPLSAAAVASHALATQECSRLALLIPRGVTCSDF